MLANFATGLAAAWRARRADTSSRRRCSSRLKTVLDNADGQLARMTGRTSVLGRYLDSECDLVSNAAVCAALGYRRPRWWVGAARLRVPDVRALRQLQRRAALSPRARRAGRGDAARARSRAALERFYALVYAPQDRLVERYVGWRLRGASPEERLAWHDRATVSVVANFGLSTQLAVLGVCLVAGSPAAYAWIAARLCRSRSSPSRSAASA